MIGMTLRIMEGLWLTGLSLWDIKKKCIPGVLLFVGFGAGIALNVWRLINCDTNSDGNWEIIINLLKSCIPGLLLLLIAFATGKSGYGDGVLLLLLGLLDGFEKCVVVTLIGFWGIALYSGICLVLHKVNRNTKIPFLPFLEVGWIICWSGFYRG